MEYITTTKALAGAVAVYTIYTAISVFVNPTSKLPGPWYTKWTSLVLKYHWLKGQRAFYVHHLHQTYGPCVRVAPDEVHFADINPLKTIYNVRESYKKTPWYLRFSTGRIENVFSTSNVDVHRRYRRLLSGAISDSALGIHFDAIRAKADHAVARMAEEMKTRGAADVSKWWFFMTSDVIGELSFGESFHALERGERTGYLLDLEQLVPLAALRTLFPTLAKVGMMLRVPTLKRAAEAAPRIRNHAIRSLAVHDKLRQEDPTRVRQTLFTKVFDAGEDGSLSFEEIVSNAQGYVIAGTDTTATTLTYLVWSVCQRPELRRELVRELRTLPPDFHDADLKPLALLNHTINETLRVYGAVPSALPREVPAGGATLAGHWLPEGTVVCCQAYSMHRDPNIWPDPDAFRPSRWENTTKAMNDAFMPFGAGSRICIGMHLSRIELRYATARFFLSFPDARVSTREGMSDDDMKPRIWFLQRQTGSQCLIEAS